MTHNDRIDHDPFLPEERADSDGAGETRGYEIDFSLSRQALAQRIVPDESFGARLRRLRIARGLSQGQLAFALGVSVPAVCGWERDRAKPHPSRLQALCDLLGISTADLLGDDPRAVKPDMITHSREQIARAVGTTADKVRIIIEL